MRVRLANIICIALVRGRLKYGCEEWGERPCPDIENVKKNMVQNILRFSSRTNEAVVRGDVCWARQKARFWWNIIRMSEDRIARKFMKNAE